MARAVQRQAPSILSHTRSWTDCSKPRRAPSATTSGSTDSAASSSRCSSSATAGRRDPLILDCGCGTGNNLTMLRRYGRACGIDITWSGLAYARRRGERRVARASATRLPFPAGQFDLVTSFDVLYAFDDEMERDALNEMYRVLRPGGQIIINVAALKVLTGNHSVLGGEVRRYTAASCATTWRGRASRFCASLTRISHSCPSSPASASPSAWPAIRSRPPR